MATWFFFTIFFQVLPPWPPDPASPAAPSGLRGLLLRPGLARIPGRPAEGGGGEAGVGAEVRIRAAADRGGRRAHDGGQGSSVRNLSFFFFFFFFWLLLRDTSMRPSSSILCDIFHVSNLLAPMLQASVLRAGSGLDCQPQREEDLQAGGQGAE